MSGSITLKYNNYNESFPITDGFLLWEAVDDEYAISFVFQGEFAKRVVGADGCEMAACAGGFKGLTPCTPYELVINEDEEAGVGNADISREYKVSITGSHTSGNSRSAQLTAELKGLSAADLAAQTDQYKQLKEARDLEDVLYSA